MKKTNITLSIALAAVFSSSVALAEVEITGKIVHESAGFTSAGHGIGAETSYGTTGDYASSDTHNGGEYFKQETSAKIYVDGDGEGAIDGATFHAELNIMHDNKAVRTLNNNENYTQRDAIREAYVDMEIDDYSIRAGKQQVVWGTADGMKLLDTINPTDYTEMAQNQMEDSRIPVWMMNVETASEEFGDMQFILSESRSHKIAGLGQESATATSHTNGDAGSAFIMKGVDSITGKVNGFMNIAPALGQVADFFSAYPGGTSVLRAYSKTRVLDYVNHDTIRRTSGGEANFKATCNNDSDGTDYCTAAALNETAQNTGAFDHLTSANAGGNDNVTNLMDVTSASSANWDTSNPNSTFEYMDQTAFGTFAAFRKMQSEYRVDDDQGTNIGFRSKKSLDSGLNYSLNYLYGNNPNPHIDLHWEDASDGSKLYACEDTNTRAALAAGDTDDGATQAAVAVTRIQLYKTSDCSTTMHKQENDGAANIVFVQKRSNIHNIGGSFDTAIETAGLGPVVLRGEALYQKDVMSQVINKAKLKIGNFGEAFKSVKTDYLKYVIGADITALTNMMVSAQFIQTRNLDYIDETVNAASDNTDVTGARYHADQSVMHLSNGFKKAEKNKEFYSLFFSKPFGASGEHRWNNIFMFEENGGKWNRLDAEFSIDDNTQVTAEYNNYWGDANTQFGQLKESSNVQVGFKYSF